MDKLAKDGCPFLLAAVTADTPGREFIVTEAADPLVIRTPQYGDHVPDTKALANAIDA